MKTHALLIAVASLLSPLRAEIDHLMLRCQDSFMSPGGELGSLKLSYWNLPPVVKPGQAVKSRLAWETLGGNPNAVVFAAVLGDWKPNDPLSDIHRGMLGRPGTKVKMEFQFVAPSRPGLYRIRWILPMAFKPITRFYSKEDRGAADPGNAVWSEVTFLVRE